MPSECLAEHLENYVSLTPGERGALSRLEERSRTLTRGVALLRENDAAPELFIVRRGTMMSYVLLEDGSRQILRFLFRGDLIGQAGLAYGEAPETIVALSECEVCPFERTALGNLAVRHPRLFALVSMLGQIEHVALTDRMVGMGRRSAVERIAALLLEIRDRQRTVDPDLRDDFVLGLTQEEIGDATGLTSVHVNRMLRQLEDQGMIARANGMMRFIDEAALAATSNYVDRRRGVDLDWLPPAN